MNRNSLRGWLLPAAFLLCLAAAPLAAAGPDDLKLQVKLVWGVNEEPKKKLKKPPTESLNRFYFDTITHSADALEFLVGSAGADRVLLGSDYPFDMGMPDGVLQVKNLSIAPVEQDAILGAHARALLGAVDRSSTRAVGAV